jgi:hypothetical protein
MRSVLSCFLFDCKESVEVLCGLLMIVLVSCLCVEKERRTFTGSTVRLPEAATSNMSVSHPLNRASASTFAATANSSLMSYAPRDIAS